MPIFRRRERPSASDTGDRGASPAPRSGPAKAPTARASRRDTGAYDAIAEAFDRGDARNTFLVARDLVQAVEPKPGERVLDVGSGTGVVPEAIREREANAFVVAADVSVGMLAVGVARGRLRRPVAAAAIDLPFRDQTFDVVTGNFVISHFPKLDTALFDLRRVLRAGGRLGVTAWVPGADEFDRVWQEVAERYAPRAVLEQSRGQVAPSEARVGDPDALRDILYAAEFRKIRVDRRGYRFEWDREEFLANRNAIRGSRYMRALLGDALWQRFQDDVGAAYREQFAERFGDSVEVLIATAVRED